MKKVLKRETKSPSECVDDHVYCRLLKIADYLNMENCRLSKNNQVSIMENCRLLKNNQSFNTGKLPTPKEIEFT